MLNWGRQECRCWWQSQRSSGGRRDGATGARTRVPEGIASCPESEGRIEPGQSRLSLLTIRSARPTLAEVLLADLPFFGGGNRRYTQKEVS